MALVPCPACQRHVHDDVATCPFCGAQLPARVQAPPAPAYGMPPMPSEPVTLYGIAPIERHEELLAPMYGMPSIERTRPMSTLGGRGRTWAVIVLVLIGLAALGGWLWWR